MSALVEPKRPQSAYFLYVNATREQVQKELGKTSFGEVTKLQADRWKTMKDTDKAPYEKQAAGLKAQYEKDLAAFKEAGGVKGQARADKKDAKKAKADKKANKLANADKPKKPAGGGYGVYVGQHRAEIMKTLPAGSKCTAVAPVASAKWKALTAEEKKPYEEKYKAAMQVYETEIKAWKESKGDNEADDDEDEQDDKEESSPKKAESAKASKADSPKAAAKAGQKRNKAESGNPEGAQTAESPPQKKGKGRGRGASKAPAKDASGPELDSAILKKASGLGLETALKNLAGRDEMANVSADKMLTALQESGGLINKAKASLLAGA